MFYLLFLFCNWFNGVISNNGILNNTFFSDEGWLPPDSYVNKQNYRICSGQNPHAIRNAPLHLVGIQLAVLRQLVCGLVFFYSARTHMARPKMPYL
jgi:hypothetical protein